MSKLNERGHEVLDPTPIAVPLHMKRPPTLQETIQRLVRNQLSRQAEAQGHETFEEADDFDVGDDYDPKSPWEHAADEELLPPWREQEQAAAAAAEAKKRYPGKKVTKSAPSKESEAESEE